MSYKRDELTVKRTPDGRIVHEHRRVNARVGHTEMSYVMEETAPARLWPGSRAVMPMVPYTPASPFLLPQARMRIEQDHTAGTSLITTELSGPIATHYKPKARQEIQKKRQTAPRPKPKPLVKKKKSRTEPSPHNEMKKTIRAGQCGTMKGTGLPCTAMVRPGTSFCGYHQLKAPTVDPFCKATVAKTGLRCTNRKQGESRWCGNHFNAWHGSNL